jgi:hypothetical protein
MKFRIELDIVVEPEAPFLELGDYDNCLTIYDLVQDFVYDQDYIKVDSLQVELDE